MKTRHLRIFRLPQTYEIARRRLLRYLIGICIQNMNSDNPPKKRVIALKHQIIFTKNDRDI
jgi:hypothetical protein